MRYRRLIAATTIATLGLFADGEERPPTARAEDGQPDRVAAFVGGIAARVHSADGTPIPGDLFVLMALAGSDASARVYDQTPYPHGRTRDHPESTESNRNAARFIADITGNDVPMVDFTSAPGGGDSAGITYAIAYFNILSDGAFSGELTVAATGTVDALGYVYPISAIDEKIAAARLADADVLFTPSIPADELVELHGTRVVGDLFRSRNTGSALDEERKLNVYGRWGTDRPDHGMDVVGVRHIGDVAAYLCGAGSDVACDITDRLENLVNDTSIPNGEVLPHGRSRSAAHRDSHASVR
ncbi:MAG: S16 family serine protease [Ilumatobacter sp.]|uniref:S16 family serine protease n=1 Tax=Ilumatobacter sp. TaxID=1967498 RepID=UPI003C75B67C